VKLPLIAVAMAGAMAVALPAQADREVRGTHVEGSSGSTRQNQSGQGDNAQRKKVTPPQAPAASGSNSQEQGDSKPYVRPPS
jgi:hypothetical protein